LNLAFSATMDNNVAEAPRGRYMPTSHSLMVCWRVPSFSESSCCVRPRWRRNAWMLVPSHCLRPVSRCFFTPAFYTMQCKTVKILMIYISYAGAQDKIRVFKYFPPGKPRGNLPSPPLIQRRQAALPWRFSARGIRADGGRLTETASALRSRRPILPCPR
jgi:hypothetical protein